MMRKPAQATVQELERELDMLEQRLSDGERRIEEAIRIGTDTAAWEQFWIELLHAYEAVYRRLGDIDSHGGRVAA